MISHQVNSQHRVTPVTINANLVDSIGKVAGKMHMYFSDFDTPSVQCIHKVVVSHQQLEQDNVDGYYKG